VRTPAITDFTRTPLFDGFGAVELAELTALATPWTAAAGDVLFRQGDHGDRLLVLSSGRLDVTARPPSGTVTAIGSIAPGEIVGELALLTGGRRAAMVRATEDSAGVALSREAFELLRLQLRPVARTVVGRIGEVALRRLLASYAAIAEDLGAPHSNETTSAGVASDHQPAALDFTSNGVPDSYLAEIFFFHRFSEPEIAELRSGLRLLTAPRGARIDPNGALWIVLRGCVQTSVVGASGRQRVRLAGPGRCVGHIGVLDGISHPPQLEAVLRERAVLLEVPHQRAHELLARNAAAAQRFTAAFFDDVVRALLAADAHIAPALRSGR
jgi:CRP-like cAMP-binding protein